MKLVKKILERLNGLHYSQEYLCLAKESFQQPLHAYLVEKGKPIKDITNSHLFVGYSPLVFALSSTTGVSEYQTSIVIAFCTRLLYRDLDSQGDNIIALLSLKRVHQQIINNELLFYYEGVHGSHHFIFLGSE